MEPYTYRGSASQTQDEKRSVIVNSVASEDSLQCDSFDGILAVNSCSLPQEDLVFMQDSLPSNGVKVFISYSRKDWEIAHKLRDGLIACGVVVWLDKYEINVGDSILMRISQALQDTHYVVLLMSEASIESPWVQREWLPVLMSEIEAREIVLLPARLDGCRIPMILRDKHYADFRQSYWRGLSEIVNALSGQLIAQHSDRIGIEFSPSSFSPISFLDSVIEAVDMDESIEVGPLLNTVVHSSFDNSCFGAPPEWLLGEWKSTKGWNEGQIFKCTNGHLVSSRTRREADEIVIGSFSSSLTEGAVNSVMSLDERTLLFSWCEERGFGMGPIIRDTGWGIWKLDADHKRLKGIWWYDVENPMYFANSSLLAYVWELEKAL